MFNDEYTQYHEVLGVFHLRRVGGFIVQRHNTRTSMYLKSCICNAHVSTQINTAYIICTHMCTPHNPHTKLIHNVELLTIEHGDCHAIVYICVDAKLASKYMAIMSRAILSESGRRPLPYHVKQAEITSWNTLVGAALYKHTFTKFGHELFLD